MKFYESGEYRATKDWPYSICAGGAVYRSVASGAEVLFVMRRAGDFPQLIDGHIDSYHLPKGHIGLSEKIDEAAIREIAEEAGCKVTISTYLGAKVNKYTDVGIKRDKIIHYFAGEWASDIGKIDNEHSDRVWVRLEEAIKLVGNENPKREDVILQRLKRYLDLINE
jgi:8-oxo-dGTP pyrophosphatase MutT (NUDIX family)